MTEVAGSSNQPTSPHPHGSDNTDYEEAVRIRKAVYLKPMAWLSVVAVFIAFCRHESFKDTYGLCLFIRVYSR